MSYHHYLCSCRLGLLIQNINKQTKQNKTEERNDKSKVYVSDISASVSANTLAIQ